MTALYGSVVNQSQKEAMAFRNVNAVFWKAITMSGTVQITSCAGRMA